MIHQYSKEEGCCMRANVSAFPQYEIPNFDLLSNLYSHLTLTTGLKCI